MSLALAGGWESEESEVAQSCLTLCNPMNCSLPRFSIHGIFPGNNTGVGCHFLLQGIFLTQGLNPGLLYWQVDSLPSESPGKHRNEVRSSQMFARTRLESPRKTAHPLVQRQQLGGQCMGVCPSSNCSPFRNTSLSSRPPAESHLCAYIVRST